MSISANTLELLMKAGLEGSALLAIVRSMEADMVKPVSTNAERQARYRAKHKAERNESNVTGDVTCYNETPGKGFDKERFHTSKEITSKIFTTGSARDGLSDDSAALVTRICEVVACIPGPLEDDATACHDAVEAAIKADGLRVFREADVRNGDGVTGRFDLVVRHADAGVAIEIDRRQMRAKSVQKLLGFDGGRIAILRGSEPAHEIDGIDATLSLPIVGRASRGTRLPENFTPLPAIVQQGLNLGLTEADISDQLERFRDWANAATGQVSIKRDWQAAFRNWIKRVADDRKKQQRFAGKQSPGDKMRQAFDDLDAEVARRRQAAGP